MTQVTYKGLSSTDIVSLGHLNLIRTLGARSIERLHCTYRPSNSCKFALAALIFPAVGYYPSVPMPRMWSTSLDISPSLRMIWKASRVSEHLWGWLSLLTCPQWVSVLLPTKLYITVARSVEYVIKYIVWTFVVKLCLTAEFYMYIECISHDTYNNICRS